MALSGGQDVACTTDASEEETLMTDQPLNNVSCKPKSARTSNRIILWVEVALWIALISYLSGDSFAPEKTLFSLQFWTSVLHLSMSGLNLESLNWTIRRAAHPSEFFVLGLLLYRAFSGGDAAYHIGQAGWVLVIGAGLALLDEFRQYLTEWRQPSLRDAFLDYFGIVASQLWLLFLAGMRNLTDPRG